MTKLREEQMEKEMEEARVGLHKAELMLAADKARSRNAKRRLQRIQQKLERATIPDTFEE